MPNLQTAQLGDIPLIWVEPAGVERRPLAIWLHAFSWTKEDVVPQLAELAARGFLALSWDMPRHGERRDESPDEMKQRVRGNLRRHFWPILAAATEEVSAVIDWATGNFDVQPDVGIGGVSMGGDIAVAAAGNDHRIGRVAAALATPDWLRPGSAEPQGEAGEAQQALYRRFDPLTNAEQYRHRPAMLFICGDEDRQVPPEGGEAFVERLGDPYADDRSRLVVVREAGVAHRFTPWMWRQALAWLEAGKATRDSQFS